MKLLLRTIKTTQKYYPFLKILQLANWPNTPKWTSLSKRTKIYMCCKGFDLSICSRDSCCFLQGLEIYYFVFSFKYSTKSAKSLVEMFSKIVSDHYSAVSLEISKESLQSTWFYSLIMFYWLTFHKWKIQVISLHVLQNPQLLLLIIC